jgi:hypothetical protein
LKKKPKKKVALSNQDGGSSTADAMQADLDEAACDP